MYGLALRITPEQMYSTAHQLYTEMRRGGYTQVCEFHYLHHQPDGTPYPDLIDMGLALVQAALDAGIGITLLPVLYERAGFQQPTLRDDQRRFATDVERVLRLRDGVRSHAKRQGWHHVTVGTAVHSLRAARAESIAELWQAVRNDPAPLHIHIAEQTGEVDDCIAATGQRPIEWLCNGLGLGVQIDARWHLVHATHATPAEIDAVARTGAAMVLCPSTEANLGDGLTDLPYWLQCGVPMAIGSDSHVTRDWREELRLAEYGQRLMHRQRNVLADPQRYGGSTASRLFDHAVQAGAQAAGLGPTGIRVGARADAVVMDSATATLDEAVFSSPAAPYSAVVVAGRMGTGQGYT
jgi:formimidoylglutamate deiminase